MTEPRDELASARELMLLWRGLVFLASRGDAGDELVRAVELELADGMPFDRLERTFAGVMLRDSDRGGHFDPRTVELKFSLAGGNGIYMPLVIDLREGVLQWLDVYSEGQLAFNDVHRSNAVISRICPEMIAYFASGVRASMLDLARLHAAARCDRVLVRGPESVSLFVRRAGEDAPAFHARLARGDADEPRAPPARRRRAHVALLRRSRLQISCLEDPRGGQAASFPQRRSEIRSCPSWWSTVPSSNAVRGSPPRRSRCSRWGRRARGTSPRRR